MKRILLGSLIAVGLASCGGDGPGLAGGRDGGGGVGGGGTGGGGGAGDTTVVMGSISGGDFQQGVVGVSTSDLAAGGSTTLTVHVRTADGAPLTEPVTVTFSSDCQAAGLAEIEEPEIVTSTGTATTTYVAQGCSGSDTVTASATVGSQNLSATGSLNVQPASLGSIEFISAEPATIGLRGTGAAGVKETSVVKFKVVNDVGGPVPDEEVSFELSTDVGGLSLTPETAITGSDGTASVTVRAGTIPTAVRITATVVGSNISTQSSALSVSTAIADQNSLSLSASVFNPEAWSIDGAEVELTILAADRFNNPVPDNTAIVFTTELGSVVAQCLTTNGACSATWRSQNPRIDFAGGDTGRTTIIAHAIGEESFEDSDGDGVFDGSLPCSTAAASEECFYDLPEAWRDDNEDGDRDAPDEDFVDFNSNGNYDDADGEWNGVVCGAGACSAKLITVSDSLTLVMARSAADVLFFDGSGNALTGTLDLAVDNVITTCIAGAGTFEPQNPATLGDLLSGQTMPAGTSIDFSAAVGEIASSKTSWTIPSTNTEALGNLCYTYVVNGGESGESGAFEVTITAPSGLETYAATFLQDTPPAP